MSFQEQERVLFDLLFDSDLRQQFIKSSSNALSEYDLTESELSDFESINSDALVLDANMRIDLLLSQFCRVFPISFSIISSFPNGIEAIKNCVTKPLMQTDLSERNTAFGQSLHQCIDSFSFDNKREKNIIVAILEAEIGMAWTSASLRIAALEPDYQASTKTKDLNWADKKIRLASFVSASILPQPYSELKKSFCSHNEAELWHRLSKKPTARNYRKKILSQENPRLLIAGATVSQESNCDPGIEHRTAELSEGFAPLFQHINGSMSINEILSQLKQSGAQDTILQSVKNGFEQLLDNEMLETL